MESRTRNDSSSDIMTEYNIFGSNFSLAEAHMKHQFELGPIIHDKDYSDLYYILTMEDAESMTPKQSANFEIRFEQQSTSDRESDHSIIAACNNNGNHCEIETEQRSTSAHNDCRDINSQYYSHEIISLVRYNPPQILVTTFQRPHEPRTKYLLRSFNLWQEFTNSGDLDKLRILFKDILLEDSTILNDCKSTPILGPNKLYEAYVSLLENIPDYCVFYSNFVRANRRQITLKVTSFGSLPFANFNNKSTFLWDIFENTSIAKLTRHHRLQKQKYDYRKSHNKLIKFETSAKLNISLSRVSGNIQKITIHKNKIDILDY